MHIVTSFAAAQTNSAAVLLQGVMGLCRTHLRRMTSHVARLLYGSMPLLGSSRNTTEGRGQQLNKRMSSR